MMSRYPRSADSRHTPLERSQHIGYTASHPRMTSYAVVIRVYIYRMYQRRIHHTPIMSCCIDILWSVDSLYAMRTYSSSIQRILLQSHINTTYLEYNTSLSQVTPPNNVIREYIYIGSTSGVSTTPLSYYLVRYDSAVYSGYAIIHTTI